MGYKFLEDAEKNSNALNLWDIETRIKRLHEELDVLHDAREDLLGPKVKYDYGTANQFHSEQ